MSFVMPEIVLQRLIQHGIKDLRSRPEAFDNIFSQFLEYEMIDDYGQAYIDQIRNWFITTKIPVVQAWSFNVSRVPCISITLSSENEATDKAAMGDHYGEDEETEILMGAFNTTLDIEVHANRDSDQVLWLYYAVGYILYKNKIMAERLGIQLQTWSANDYGKNNPYAEQNIWTRRLKVSCITLNSIDGDALEEATETKYSIVASSTNSSNEDIAVLEDFTNEDLE